MFAETRFADARDRIDANVKRPMMGDVCCRHDVEATGTNDRGTFTSS
jgi:hypothetical protein